MKVKEQGKVRSPTKRNVSVIGKGRCLMERME